VALPSSLGAPAPLPAATATAAAATMPSPAPRGGAPIALEFEENPALAGRPRLSQDGSLLPGPRGAVGGPRGDTPDSTYPASFAGDASNLTSMPKTREVWPTWQPWRPTLLSRAWRRFRKEKEGAEPEPGAGSEPSAASARSEPRDFAERGQGVERLATDRLDEPPQR
jgi:hypothetical protein